MTYYIGALPCTPYLEHHGVQGMKWGERKYQNADGSLTALGRAHYGVENIRGKLKPVTDRLSKVTSKMDAHQQRQMSKLNRASSQRFTRSERKHLERLKKIKQDPRRMSLMSERQRKRLDADIEFYTKRSKGQAAKKNLLSRYMDYNRSQSAKSRYVGNVTQNLLLSASKKTIKDIMPVINNGGKVGVDTVLFKFGKNSINSVIPSLKSAASDMVKDELYNRAVGRY